MKGHSIIKGLLVSGVAVSFAWGCGKKKSDDAGTTTTTSSTDPSSVTSSNPLAAAYPTSLAITAFPTDSSSSLALGDSKETSDTKVEMPTGKEKNEEAAKILKGEADSCVPAGLKEVKAGNVEELCYEFDQDMIYGSMDGGTKFKGTKDGKNSAGEACLVAFARSKIDRVVGAVDRSLGMIQMMMCQAKKSGVATELDAVGDSVDLTTSIKAADSKMAPSVAKVTRLADVTDGSETYKSFKSEVTVTRGDGVEMGITLYHVAKDSTNTKYYGVLQMSESMSTKEATIEGISGNAKKRLMSISYGRDVGSDGTPSIAYELRNGMFVTALVANAFGTDKLLDFNNGADFTGDSSSENYGQYTGYSNANDAVHGITYIAFNGNPDTNAGTFSYWQNPGSKYKENARGMIATLESKDSVLSGCAYSGATGYNPQTGFSIRQSIKETKTLAPKGFYHPFFSESTGSGSDTVGTYYTKTQGPSTAKWYKPEDTTNGAKFVSEQMSNLVTKQCFKQDATSKAYVIDSAIVTSAKGYEFVETEASKGVVEPPKQIFKEMK